MSAAFRVLVGGSALAVGWFAGSVFPMPGIATAEIRQRTDALITSFDVGSDAFRELADGLSTDELARLAENAADLAASHGAALVMEHDMAAMQEYALAVATPAAAAEVERSASAPQSSGRGSFETGLTLCPGMTIANAPGTTRAGEVSGYSNVVSVKGVAIAVNPTEGACLSSGFGSRNGSVHKGIDYHSATGGPILAGGDGVVIEKKYRDDYGNMLLIDHGQGVYTRYAHLSSFASGIAVGSAVSAGQRIGLMGNTAAFRIPIHLHYEVLTGDYANPKASFGLEAVSPFDYPPAG